MKEPDEEGAGLKQPPSKTPAQDLCELQRDAALGRLVGAIVHESRNVLTGVLTFAQVGAAKADDPDKAKEMFGRIEREVKRCVELFAGTVVAVRGRKSVVDEKECDVAEVIRSAEMLTQHKLAMDQVSLQLDLKGALGLAPIAANDLNQVLVNLILNANAAIGKNGRVTVEGSRSRDHIVVRVSDDGPGVPETVRPHIFESFFTTKGETGGGLGLSISRELIERAGGTLELAESPLGAHFEIKLPP